MSLDALKHVIRLSLPIALLAACLLLSGCREAPDAAADSSQPSTSAPTIDGCQVFPADNPWNTDISSYPVHPNSANFIASIGADTGLHEDFGTVWQGAPIEGGPDSEGDRHILMVDVDNAMLYELFHCFKTEDGWRAGSGAIFDLTSNDLRPLGWTSADAAGLPIFPGLVRYDEVVQKGEVNHALRFTCRRTQRGYILPATHFASRSSDPNLPPMGLRLRLKADYDISSFPAEAQVILTALKKYGLILADNGGDWFISGAPDMRWNTDNLRAIRRVKGSDFEVVDTGPIHTG